MSCSAFKEENKINIHIHQAVLLFDQWKRL